MDGLDVEGKLFTAPVAWTDAAEEDPYVTVSRGRAMGRASDLLRLVQLVEEVGR